MHGCSYLSQVCTSLVAADALDKSQEPLAFCEIAQQVAVAVGLTLAILRYTVAHVRGTVLQSVRPRFTNTMYLVHAHSSNSDGVVDTGAVGCRRHQTRTEPHKRCRPQELIHGESWDKGPYARCHAIADIGHKAHMLDVT